VIAAALFSSQVGTSKAGIARLFAEHNILISNVVFRLAMLSLKYRERKIS
jgi:hypothetical protein